MRLGISLTAAVMSAISMTSAQSFIDLYNYDSPACASQMSTFTRSQWHGNVPCDSIINQDMCVKAIYFSGSSYQKCIESMSQPLQGFTNNYRYVSVASYNSEGCQSGDIKKIFGYLSDGYCHPTRSGSFLAVCSSDGSVLYDKCTDKDCSVSCIRATGKVGQCGSFGGLGDFVKLSCKSPDSVSGLTQLFD
jgi:hypothetical protein